MCLTTKKRKKVCIVILRFLAWTNGFVRKNGFRIFLLADMILFWISEEEDDSGNYDDEGSHASALTHSLSDSLSHSQSATHPPFAETTSGVVAADMPLEDKLVGTWQRQDGMKDREYESIQVVIDVVLIVHTTALSFCFRNFG